jgi:3-deoxy-7-phosphoheptulonate synthase
VGFKNGTDGGLEVALNALQSAAHPHRFLGINEVGQVAVTTTSGNPSAHIVLRGGNSGPNFDRASITACEAKLTERGLPGNIMIDASHANSAKDPMHQHQVATAVVAQLQAGNTSIIGLMFESNLAGGRQDLQPNKPLLAGVSLTDACISFESTQDLLRYLNQELAIPLQSRERNHTEAA